MTPILANDGRTIIGHAKTLAGAERVLRNMLTIHPRMTLRVYMRDPITREINSGPMGFMYSIFYGY